MAKSRSVQEQNCLQKEAVLNEARYWREHP